MEKPKQEDVIRLLKRCAARGSRDRENAVRELWDIAANHAGLRSLCLSGIRAAISDPEVLVRNASAEALWEVGNRNDLKRLRAAHKDEDWLVRASATEAYSRAGGKRGMPVLVKVMREDPECVVRGCAADGIKDIGDTAGIEPLLAQLAVESEPRTQVSIHFALVLLGCLEYAVPLARLVQDKNWHAVCDAAMIGLEELIEKGLVVDPHAGVVKRELEAYAEDGDLIEWRQTKALGLAARLG
jgi:HEAT repeat protein